MPELLRFVRQLAACLLLALVTLPAPPVHAANIEDLLPVDQAFALTTRAEGDGIVLRWAIAPGYYLYRHRTSVQADAGFHAGALQMPRGKAHTDEFFGRVETYHDELVARLPGQARAAQTVLTVRYQGCADAGICYPPQTRRVTVALDPPPAVAPRDPFARSVMGKAGLQAGADAAPLPAEQAFAFDAIAADGNRLLLRFTPAPGYYLYRDRTTLQLDSASTRAGLRLGRPLWPTARAHRDEHFGQVQVYFDEAEVPVPVLRRRPDATALRLTATFQGCQTDGICYPPMTRTVAIDLPAGIVDTRATKAGESSALVTPLIGSRPAIPAGERALGTAALPDNGLRTRPPAPARPVEGLPGTPPGRPAPIGVFSALLLALLGGLVLNLMPCVLPVLSLKALSLAESGSPATARRHALWYTSGVVLSFLLLGGAALALRESGRALGWGFQLQQPLVVAVLALVIFALGLGLSGLWHAGGRWVGAGDALTRRSGAAGDFFTGVLAVIVATPCTAPFMGAALAWAFLAPAPLALAVFATLGLGLALPFVLIGLVPALALRLPRPGAWMETLKQALAFPLYLTAAWLLWVLGRQRGADAIAWALVAAIAVAFAAWGWSRARYRRPAWGLLVLTIAAGVAVYALATVQRLPRPDAPTTVPASGAPVPFSQARLDSLRAEGRVVFVNVTADWCVTCKANDRAVLERPAFRKALADTGAVYMQGDWTDVDPALTRFLQSHGAVGVPLYVVYSRRGQPHVLPTLLTPSVVDDALREAAR